MSDGPKLVPFPVAEPTISDQVTPIQCLEDLLARARRGEYDPSALIVIGVYDQGNREGYVFDRTCAGPQTMAETHFWLTLAVARVLAECQG